MHKIALKLIDVNDIEDGHKYIKYHYSVKVCEILQLLFTSPRC